VRSLLRLLLTFALVAGLIGPVPAAKNGWNPFPAATLLKINQVRNSNALCSEWCRACLLES
jgi:hypothetical protein